MDGANHPTQRALVEARDAVIDQLTESFAHDEIGLDQFEERIADAYQCTTAAQLGALVLDLDGAAALSVPTVTSALANRELTGSGGAPRVEIVHPASTALVPVGRARPFARAVLGTVERRGTFSLRDGAAASAVLGSLVIDLREATLGPGVTELYVRAFLGSVEVIVSADVAVECEGTGFLGTFEGATRAPSALDPDAPRLRIIGSAVLGSIEVRARPPARVQLRIDALRAKRLHQ